MQEEFQDKAGSAVLARKLAHAKSLFACLKDEKAGFYGSHVLARLEQNGLTFEGTGKNQKGFASYRPFDPTEAKSYINVITCPVTDDGGAERDDIDFDGSAFHEIIHAVSWDRVPELHASPFNANSPVILCPEDFALMTVLTERVAYSHMGWLLSMAQTSAPEIGHVVTPVNAMMFDFMRAREADLGRALALAADVSMRETLVKRDKSKVTMEEYYYSAALEDYEAQVKILAQKKIMPLVVRLEPHNLRSIAESFGPNIMDYGQDFTPIRPDDQKRIASIYALLAERHTVPGYNNLPTFDAALAKRGYSPASFLEMSKTAGAASQEPAVAPEPVRKAAGSSFFGSFLPAAGVGTMAPA